MYKFLIFDIKDYYSSSVQKELLNKGLRIAEENIDIFGNDTEIIHHARKSLFFWWKGHMYEKQNDLIVVTMGAYDSAEVCELV